MGFMGQKKFGDGRKYFWSWVPVHWLWVSQAGSDRL